MPDPTHQDKAREVLEDLTKRRDALSEEAYARSENGTFSVDFGKKMEEELVQLNAELGALREEFIAGLFVTEVNDHTFTYRVLNPSAEKSQEAHIRDKLGEKDAKVFIKCLKNDLGINVSIIKVPKVNEATLDINSNRKPRSEQQQLYEGGLADAIQAINIALEAVSLAKVVDIDLAKKGDGSSEEWGTRKRTESILAGLDEGTATVLEKLVSGYIRFGNSGSSSGSLSVDGDGRLYAGFSHGLGHFDYWAFGARPAPESKN